jgi:AAA ATPase domain
VCRKLVRALSLTRPRGVGGLPPVFVGRGSELAQLQEAYRRVVASGRALLVSVVGDAGVGKTRLVREFWRWLGRQPEQPLLRSGRCLSYGQGITYWPLGEVLKEHLGIRESDPPEVVAGRVAGREGLGFTLGLAAAAGDASADRAGPAAHVVGGFPGRTGQRAAGRGAGRGSALGR